MQTRSLPLKTLLSWPYLLYYFAFFVIFIVLAISMGTDASPDFRNYHLYNGFAALHDRSSLDIFPAQLQTTFFPGLDAIYYYLFIKFNETPLFLNALLSLPYGIATSCIFLLALKSMPSANMFICAVAALFGMTGAAVLPTLSTTMSEIVPGLPLLCAITLWCIIEKQTICRSFILGAIAGISVGLKLTLLPVYIALFVAIFIKYVFNKDYVLLSVIFFGLGSVIIFFIIDAHWLWYNYKTYDNPIFPFMNNIFQSDLVEHTSWRDMRFLPKSILMTLCYPAFWAFDISQHVIELNMRDPRIFFGYFCSIYIIVSSIIHMVQYRVFINSYALYISIIFLISYYLWQSSFSIYRYLAIQEGLSAILLLKIITCIFNKFEKYHSIKISNILFCIIVATSIYFTHYPWWSRTYSSSPSLNSLWRSGLAIDISLPSFEDNSMVIFLDPYAYSYLIPFFPENIRVLGVYNNLVNPNSTGALHQKITEAVHNHDGALWGIEYAKAFPEIADFSLDKHELMRTENCFNLKSNIEIEDPITICKLKRKQTIPQ